MTMSVPVKEPRGGNDLDHSPTNAACVSRTGCQRRGGSRRVQHNARGEGSEGRGRSGEVELQEGGPGGLPTMPNGS